MGQGEDEILLEFAQNLARLIEARGGSVATLAAAAGMDPIRIERLLAARVEPGAIEIMRLAKALNVTPGHLLGE